MGLNTIEKIAISDGNRDFIKSDHYNYSYLEAKYFIDKASDEISRIGKKGDPVIIKDPSPVHQLLYFLSSWKAELISVIVPPNISNERYNRLIRKINPQIIIDDSIRIYKEKEACDKNKYLNAFLGALSSGTTGEEKIIWRSYDSWQRAFQYQSKIFHINKGDRLLLNGDFNYTANLNSALHILSEGGTIVHTKQKRPAQIMSLIDKKRVDAIFMVPALYRILTTYNDNKSLNIRSVVSAGSKIDMCTLKRLKQIFPQARIIEYYGASELGHVSYMTYEDSLKKEGSVGRAFPEVKVIIENKKIWVKSPYIADEYPSKHSAGDMGFLDEDGYLFLIGREGNIINKAGEKIIAEEIERVLVRYPNVNEAAVIGRAHDIKGEEVMAFVAVDGDINEVELKRDIRKFCAEYLECTKIPKQIIIVKRIPKNENGKIDRRLLKNQEALKEIG